jgi:hypothetical protein
VAGDVAAFDGALVDERGQAAVLVRVRRVEAVEADEELGVVLRAA